MLARGELLDNNRGIGLGFLPLSTIDTILHLGIEVFTGSVQQMDGSLGLVFLQNLLCETDAQSLFTVTQRQREFAAMGLTGRIGNVGCHHKVVEHRITGLGHLQRHGDIKRTIIVCLSRTTIYLITLTTIVQG